MAREAFTHPYYPRLAGPNGTGKSAIVCAIALGLAGKPEVLGRAKDIKDFVRKGEEDAIIEIELKRRTKKGNIIIERHLSASNNKSTWVLDGKQANEAEVKKTIAKLNIQVDNLCQFLPQDRVCEFAQLSPPALLLETERAAGGDEMVAKHQSLIEIKTEVRGLQSSVDQDTTHLTAQQKRFATLDEQVQRIMERQRHLEEVRNLDFAIPWKNYQSSVEEFKKVREEKKAIEARRLQQSTELVPLTEELSETKIALIENDRVDSDLRKTLTQKVQKKLEKEVLAMEKADEMHITLSDRVKAAQKRLAAAEKSVKIDRQKLAKVQESADELTEQLRAEGLLDAQGNFHSERSAEHIELDRRNTDCSDRLATNSTEYQQSQARLKEAVMEKRNVTKRIEKAEAELGKLHEVENQKLHMLSRYCKDTYQLHQWFLRNKETQEVVFEKPVFEPIGLLISTRPEHAQAVEAAIGRGHLIVSYFSIPCGFGTESVVDTAYILQRWLVQTKNDYEALTAQCFDKMKLRCNVAMVSSECECERFRPEDLREMGFDGVIRDFVSGPPEPVNWSGSGLNFHLIDANNDVNRYYVGQESFTVSRGYGSTSSRQTQMNDPQMLRISFDSVREADLQREIEDLKTTDLAEANRKVSEAKEAEDRFRSIDAQIRAEKVGIATISNLTVFTVIQADIRIQREALVKRKNEYEQKMGEVSAFEVKVNNDEKNLRETEKKIEEQEKELVVSLRKRGKLAIRFMECQKEQTDLMKDRTMLRLSEIQLSAKRAYIEDRIAEIKRSNMDIERQFQDAKRRVEDAKQEARRLKAQAEEISANFTEEQRTEIITAHEDKEVEELEELRRQAKARLDILSDQQSDRVLEDHRKLKEQIEKIQEQLQQKGAKIEQLNGRIEGIEGDWLPELDGLIKVISAAFSSAFEKIGCTGEVELGKHEDYSQWGINIRVKFREEEVLQALTAHRQSGGERSVSTILYLMALQEVSKAPFRVVDEINQGMDPRNERAVHDQIVEAGCKPGGSQYFLITPKLLSDLKYTEKMKVLTIYNGEALPERFSIRDCINLKRGRQRHGA
ncbi:Structural maintenance of chromosomes protein 5 [Irineochytrium annulatum]|nr:Structural maintenance of chromosomes protein 5 [Irineochytrium annulatum]